MKEAVQGDVSSIQNDLNATLPALISQADAAPGSVPEAFAVYRNVDALYDVLLRVTENANLMGAQDQATALQSALDGLKQARSGLGDSIVNHAKNQQAQLVQLRTAIAHAEAVSERKPEKTIVVDDGATSAATHHPRRHTTTKKAPASSTTPASTSSSQNLPSAKPQQ
ncbi:hypothetical protein [Paracidobacterium acidisoli]|uniref:Uncharacterized protein n=1 Tax=Paracidobacterium acidisoli TaxID=2303751 RepID=A0A372ILB2_9BACT|nr:hypothetical protein [Paracidobacterium acidisoli]MBT9332328.1 hypothetical protein [Paracidobacterium acidisoli]